MTHEHGDHHAGLAQFPGATWWAAGAVAEAINRSGTYAGRVQCAEGRLLGAIDVAATPGHTPSHHSLRFDCEGTSVVIAGDAVVTRDFWQDRRGFYNAADFSQASETMTALASLAQVIVPGHDKGFPVHGTSQPLP